MTIRLEGTQGVRKCIMLLSAMLLAAVSCSIRIAAAPLFLVIAGAACGIKTERIVQTLRSRKFWLYACAALIAGSSALVIVAKTTDLCASGGYLDDFMKQSKAWSFSTIIEIVGMHLKESIQLFYGRVPAPLIPYRYLFIIPLFSLLAYSLITFGRRVRFCIILWIFSYGAMVFIWPYYDPRFLFPILPFVFVILFMGLRFLCERAHAFRFVVIVYALYYMSMGVIMYVLLANNLVHGDAYYKKISGMARESYEDAYLRTVDEVPPERMTRDLYYLKIMDPYHVKAEPRKLELSDSVRFPHKGLYWADQPK
ncbi:MAG: hypothetical protein IKA58_05495 [Clostridia bacterium]|nr:hypothetical protein [Clostridia bacterium]